MENKLIEESLKLLRRVGGYFRREDTEGKKKLANDKDLYQEIVNLKNNFDNYKE